MKPSIKIETLPPINTAEGKRIAKNIAARIIHGETTMRDVPNKYKSYVEGEIKGAEPVRKAINTTGVKIAAPVVGAAALPAFISAASGLLPHTLSVLANPASATTTAGSMASTALDASGLIASAQGLSNSAQKIQNGNYTLNYVPETVLSGLGALPGASVLTRGSNWATAANTYLNTTNYISPLLIKRLPKYTASTFGANSAESTAANVPVKWTFGKGDYSKGLIYTPIITRPSQTAHEFGHHVSYHYPGLRKGDAMGALTNKYNYGNEDWDIERLENYADWFKTKIGFPYKGRDKDLLIRQIVIDNNPTKTMWVNNPNATLHESNDFSGVENIVRENIGFGGARPNLGLQKLKTENRSKELLKNYDIIARRNAYVKERFNKTWDELTPEEQYGVEVKFNQYWQ